MPMTLRVGYARKLGRPGFGSVGASCGLDLELDGGLLERDPQGLRSRIRAAFAACRAAVAEELADQTAAEADAGPQPDRPPSTGQPPLRRPTGADPDPSPPPPREGLRASEKQVKAIRAIARRHGADLTAILRQDHGVDRPEQLSVAQASRLIDALKADTAV